MIRILLRALLLAVMGFLTCASASARPPTIDPTYGLPAPHLQPPPAHALPDASWIWASRTADNQTVYARAVLTLPQMPGEAYAFITADNFFTLYVNGQRVEGNSPQSEAGGWQHVHRVSIARWLTNGANVIAVEAQNTDGPAGLLARVDVGGKPALLSGAQWKVLDAPAAPAGWNRLSFDDHDWSAASVIAPIGSGPWGGNLDDWPGFSTNAWYLAHLYLAPVAVEVLSGASVIHGTENLTSPGSGIVEISPASTPTPAVLMLDFGQELAGRLQLFGTDGQLVQVTTGESREECLRAPDKANRWAGPYALTLESNYPASTPYSAFRYARLTFTGTHPVELTGATFDHKYYPVRYLGAFDCSDPLLTRIWYAGAYTAHLCMQEDIWDAPKRDRARWIGDLHVSGEVINTVFADTFLMEQTLQRLRDDAQGSHPPGTLPAGGVNSIPGYTAAWFCTLADFHRHIGDKAFLRRNHANILTLLDWQKQDFDSRHIFTNPRKVWDYVDWAPGFVQHTPLTLATTDLFIIKGVREAVFLLTAIGDKVNAAKYSAWADTLTAAARHYLPDAQAHTYSDTLQENAMAIYSGVATPQERAAISSTVLAPTSPAWQLPPNHGATAQMISPYYSYYVLQADGEMGRTQDGLDLIRRNWGAMLARGSGTFWENFDSSWPTDMNKILDANSYLSLSHGWSAGPTVWLTEHILGVTSTGAGFRTAQVVPHLGDLRWAQGDIPTPHGVLHVRAQKQGLGLAVHLTVPPGISVRVGLPGSMVRINGQPALSRHSAGGTTYLTLPRAGTYTVSSL